MLCLFLLILLCISLQADARCELCKFSVELLDKALKEGGPGLNNTLYGLCDKIPVGQWQDIVCHFRVIVTLRFLCSERQTGSLKSSVPL